MALWSDISGSLAANAAGSILAIIDAKSKTQAQTGKTLPDKDGKTKLCSDVSAPCGVFATTEYGRLKANGKVKFVSDDTVLTAASCGQTLEFSSDLRR